MSQSPGFDNEKFPNHICRLHKAIYGLQQALHAWYVELKSYLLSLSFHYSQCDRCIFTYEKFRVIIYLVVYVDNLIITGN